MFRVIETLPKVTKKQKETKLSKIEIERESLILCAAFESRFKIFAIGCYSGKIILQNQVGRIMISQTSIDVPICSIFSCHNSTSFITFSSESLFKNSINQLTPLNKENISKIPKGKTIIAHWIFINNEIKMRKTAINYDVTHVAMSPTHPEYAVLCCSDGTISGFSIEDLELTNLLIDIYKGKKIESIFCQRDLVYYVAHDSIDKLNLTNMEVTEYSKESVTSIDVIDDQAAVIGKDGNPKFLKKGKISSTIEIIPDHTCVYSSMISQNRWIFIFRSATGDKIFVDGKETVNLENDFIIPSIIIDYADPFERTNPSMVGFVTFLGKFVSIDKSFPPKSIILPKFNNPKAFNYEKVFYIVEQKEDSTIFHHFDDFNYTSCFKHNKCEVLTLKGDLLICYEGNQIILVEPKFAKISPLYIFQEPVKKIQVSRNFVDIVLGNGKIISMNLESIGYSFNDLDIPKFNSNIKLWRRIRKKDNSISYVFITDKNEIITESAGPCKIDKKKKASLVGCEIINEEGKCSLDGYILVITNRKMKLIEPNKLKTIKKCKFHNDIVSYTILDWGAILLLYSNSAELIPLPDISHQPLGKMIINPEVEAYGLVPYSGICLFYNPYFQFYTLTDEVYEDKPFINDNPPISEKPIKSLLGLISQPPPTIGEADASFKRERAESSLSDTIDIMQQMLVQASLRSEELNKMEEKAQQISKKAENFYKRVLRMNEGFK